MKRGLLILFLVLAGMLAAALQGCKGNGQIDPEPPEEVPLLIDTTIIVPATGGKNLFSIISHSSWKTSVVSGAAWCHVTPADGGSGGATIAVVTDDNDEFEVRQARVEIHNATTNGYINVIQQQIDVLDVTTGGECDFGPQGGTFGVDVGYNIDYEFSVSEGWVRQIQSKALRHTTMMFEVDKNNSGTERICEVIFTGGGFSRTVIVNQTKAYISLSISDVAVAADVDRLPVMVESNVSYRASLPEEAWISITGDNSAGTDGQQTSALFDLALQENEGWFLREAEVLFGNQEYNLSGSLHLLQKAVDIMYASLPLFEFGPEGGSFEFDTDPTKEYKFTVDGADWIKVSTPEGSLARRIITVDKSLLGEERTASVTINRGNAKKTLDFHQVGVAPEFSTKELRFATAGGSQTLSVTGSVEYTVVPPEDASWCTVSEAEDGGYTVTVAANDTEQSRACQIGFVNKEYEVSETVEVFQAQKDAFEVTPLVFSFGPEGGKAEVVIHTNIDYTYESDSPEWISEKQGSAHGKDFEIVLNDTGEARQGNLTFTADGFETIVTIDQNAAFIAASEHSFTFDDQSADRSVAVESNIPILVMAEGGDWLTVGEITDGQISFALSENNDWGSRHGEIILYNNDYQASDTITVFQGAKYYLDIAKMEFDLQPQGGLVTLEVHSNKAYEYHIDGSPDWIRELTPLSFEIDPNTTEMAREAQIVFEQNGFSKIVSITQDAPMLMLTPSKLEFPSSGGESAFSVTANIDFEVAQPSDQWVGYTAAGAGSYTVIVAPNDMPEKRISTLDISSGAFGICRQLEIEQAQLDIFEISVAEFYLSPTAEEIQVDLNTNIDYSYTFNADWVTDNGHLAFAVGKNTSDKSRECIIEFLVAGESYLVTITQAAPYLRVDKTWLDFPVDGGDLAFTIESNIGYEVLMPEEDWISYSTDGSGTYTLSAPANLGTGARSCLIKIEGQGFDLSETITAGQEVMDFFELSTKDFSISPAQQNVQVELRTNREYTYTVDQDWITDEGNLVFHVDKNDSDQARVAIIEFSAGDITQSVTVSQSAPFLNLQANQVDFTFDGGEASFTIEANIEYEVSVPEEDWIMCTEVSEGVYTISVEANGDDWPRECTISILAPAFNKSKELTIRQESGDVFEIAVTQFEFGPEGGVFDISVHTNLEYSYQISGDWLADAGNLQFEVPKNTTGQARECVVDFLVGDDTYSVTVSQSAPFLSLDVDDIIELDQQGGEFEVSVSNNVPFVINILQEDWISVGEVVESGVYPFKVTEFTGYKKRSGTIEFIASDYGLTQSVTVSQIGAPEPFSVKQRDFFVGPCGGELEVVHTECQEVEVSIFGASWIRELPAKREDTLLVFKLDTLFTDSTREAVVSVVGAGRSQTVYIFQNPPLMMLTYHEKSFPDTGGTLSIEMISNFAPEFYTDQDWVSGSVADDFSSISFTVAPNDTGVERTAVVEVGLKQMDYVQEVTITQAANDQINLDPAQIDVPSEGGEYYVTVDANVSYSTMAVTSWINFSSTETPNLYKVKVAANTSAKSRASSVMFSGGKATSYLRVNQAGYRNPDYYYSEDFSKNHTSVKIQSATEGDGIPLVLMGDAFSDRLIDDGTYERQMRRAVEAIFEIEPYKSHRNLFNIWYINIVSLNEIYADDATTELSTHFEQGSVVTGDHSAVRSLVMNLLNPLLIKNAAIVVLMNTETYGGSTYMYDYLSQDSSDWGVGEAIAYIPLCTSDEQFTGVVQHEVGGHCIGKLEDEYYYSSSGAIPASKVDYYKKYQAAGFYRNVDFTSNPSEVLWAKFLTDEDYQYDGLGVFEGACIYSTGAYRATQESMMYHNEGGFNAPSREAIYYRLHKIAYGASWQYNFEEFKQYDVINRRSSPSSSQTGRKKSSSAAGAMPHLPPPVMLKR